METLSSWRVEGRSGYETRQHPTVHCFNPLITGQRFLVHALTLNTFLQAMSVNPCCDHSGWKIIYIQSLIPASFSHTHTHAHTRTHTHTHIHTHTYTHTRTHAHTQLRSKMETMRETRRLAKKLRYNNHHSVARVDKLRGHSMGTLSVYITRIC